MTDDYILREGLRERGDGGKHHEIHLSVTRQSKSESRKNNKMLSCREGVKKILAHHLRKLLIIVENERTFIAIIL